MNRPRWVMFIPPMCWEREQQLREAAYRDWLRKNYSETYLKKHYPWILKTPKL